LKNGQERFSSADGAVRSDRSDPPIGGAAVVLGCDPGTSHPRGSDHGYTCPAHCDAVGGYGDAEPHPGGGHGCGYGHSRADEYVDCDLHPRRDGDVPSRSGDSGPTDYDRGRYGHFRTYGGNASPWAGLSSRSAAPTRRMLVLGPIPARMGGPVAIYLEIPGMPGTGLR